MVAQEEFGETSADIDESTLLVERILILFLYYKAFFKITQDTSFEYAEAFPSIFYVTLL